MEQKERREYLINYLLKEGGYDAPVPKSEIEEKRLLRSLFNVRMPNAASEEFLKIQDEYLHVEIAKKGITDCEKLTYTRGLTVWQGDITTLKADGIVNAANSQMLGCFAPCHACIDNAIHTFAGIRLRKECYDIMRRQRTEEPTGSAKITKAYNLPSKFVLHTVGPIVSDKLTEKHKEQLASCYRSCLALAKEYGLRSLAFCCISTGEFHFPNKEAAEIAVSTVSDLLEKDNYEMKVIFNVFKDTDLEIYQKLLAERAGENL
ncbi:MAG: protein-ADP-ribose hydrolase [Clostridia bacterium]|nr:protein-ADP-ribose hydrolase [Clostridia bacterium]